MPSPASPPHPAAGQETVKNNLLTIIVVALVLLLAVSKSLAVTLIVIQTSVLGATASTTWWSAPRGMFLHGGHRQMLERLARTRPAPRLPEHRQPLLLVRRPGFRVTAIGVAKFRRSFAPAQTPR